MKLSVKGWTALVSGLGVLLLGSVAVLIMMLSGGGGPTPVVEGKTVETAKPVEPPKKAAAPEAPRDEEVAKRAFDSAQSLEKTDPTRAVGAYHELRVRHPGTTWAKKAEERTIALESVARHASEAEYKSLAERAETLARDGRWSDALQVLEGSRDARAVALAGAMENRAREEFNRAVKEAKIETFEAIRPRTLHDLAALCERAIEQLQEVRVARAEFEKEKAAYERDKALLEKCRSLWPRLARRDYDGAPPDLPADDRTLIDAAAAFWKAFLDARAKAGPMRLLAPDGKPFLAKPAEVPADGFHRDSIAALAYSSLPTDKPETYVKAAMWYWFEGHADLAGRELATAKEFGDVTTHEEAFRGGWLRNAAPRQ